MSKRAKSLIIFASIISQSPAALAGYYNSSIQGISVDGVYENKSPTDVSRIVCEKYKYGNQYKKEHLDMCNEGVIAAHTMAQQYAQGEGKYLGCIDGYQQGLYKGYQQTSNPSAAQLDDARKLLSSSNLKTAMSRGESKATSESRYSTEGEIIQRFRGVVRADRNQRLQTPSDDYSQILKIPDFDGYSDGYSYDDQGGSFSNVISKGWVNSNSSIRKKIEARAVARQFGISGNLSEMCSSAPVLFNKSLHTISIWDIFSVYGEYNFKDYGWKSTDRAWNKFASSDSNDAMRYKNIQAVKMNEQYISGYEKKPQVVMESGVEKRDASGRVVFEMVEDKTRPLYSSRAVDVPGSSRQQLQAVYQNAFSDAYQNLAKDYFGKAFVSEHAKLRNIGEVAGIAIGTVVSSELATQEAYNAKYKTDSAVAFAKKYKDGFVASWNKNFDYFVSNPVVEIFSSLNIIGEDADGIYRPGEEIRPVFQMRNIGLASGKINIKLGESAEKSVQVDSITAPASLEFLYDTQKFEASLSSSLRAGESAKLVVSVDGSKSSQVLSLNNKAESTIRINEIAEIRSANLSNVSISKGEGYALMTIANPSTKKNPSNIDVRLNLDNNLGEFKTSVIALEGGQVKSSLPVSFNAVDPLDMITKGEVSGTISVYVGNRRLDSKRVSTNIEKRSSVADYFTSILMNKTQNFGDEDRTDRIDTLRTYIIDLAVDDLRREIKWRDNKVVSQTMIGRLQSEYLAAGAAGKLSEELKVEFKLLAQELEKIWTGVFGYDDYINQLKVLNGEIQKRGKKDRK